MGLELWAREPPERRKQSLVVHSGGGKDSPGSQARDHLYTVLAKILMVSCPCSDIFRSELKKKKKPRTKTKTKTNCLAEET